MLRLQAILNPNMGVQLRTERNRLLHERQKSLEFEPALMHFTNYRGFCGAHLQLHAHAVAKAQPVPGISRTGVNQ